MFHVPCSMFTTICPHIERNIGQKWRYSPTLNDIQIWQHHYRKQLQYVWFGRVAEIAEIAEIISERFHQFYCRLSYYQSLFWLYADTGFTVWPKTVVNMMCMSAYYLPAIQIEWHVVKVVVTVISYSKSEDEATPDAPLSKTPLAVIAIFNDPHFTCTVCECPFYWNNK